jgi:hypothetical protein
MARRISLVDISSRRRRVRRALFWGGIVIAIALLIAGVLWLVARSNFLKIREVEISGATYIPEEQIREFFNLHVAQGRIGKFLGPDNVFAWPEEFSKEDLVDLPAASSIEIERRIFDRKISVTVEERERVGIWCFSEAEPKRCFWFDPNGILFMPGYFAEGNLIPLLEDHSREPLALGERALEARFLPNLVSIFSALDSIHLSISEVRLSDLGREEVEARTYEGPRLLFSLRFPSAGVPDAIKAVEKITALSKLQYVDFRVENKVYYK